MRFESHPVEGDGRGRQIGLPTINLAVPAGFALPHGVYAARTTIGDRTFRSALHYGPVPTYGKRIATIEVHLLDVSQIHVPDGTPVSVEVLRHIRPVQVFPSTDALVGQVKKDIALIHKIIDAS